jgi:hypothetical protein
MIYLVISSRYTLTPLVDLAAIAASKYVFNVEIPDSSEIDPAPTPVSVAAYLSVIVAATSALLLAEELPI